MLIPNLKETVQKAISDESVRIPGIAFEQNKRCSNEDVQKTLYHAITFKLQTVTGM